MSRRPRLWVAVALAAVLSVAIGVAVCWFAVLPGQRARQTADAVASAFAAGSAGDGVFAPVSAGAGSAGTDGAPGTASQELARLYAGMGELRPSVRVRELVDEPDGRLRVNLDWSWLIHEGKPAWEYATSVVLERQEGPQWRAVFTPDAVAPGLGAEDRLRATRLAPVRGAIVGQRGEALAWNQPAYVVGIDKTLTDAATAAASAARLAAHLGVDVDRFVARVNGAGPRAFVDARVLRVLDPAERSLAETARRWIGVQALETKRPLGLTSSFARPLLGVVGEATAEQVAASGGRIRGGDLAGRGGLQEARDHVLAGTTGFVVSRAPAAGDAQELFRVDKLDGTDVRTTIDVPLQAAAEGALGDVSSASAIVAIRPSDGAILAAASGPGSQGYSTATLGQHAPGSTFKVVTALALLRAGGSVDDPVTCSDGLVVDGYRFDNWQGYPVSSLGEIPLREAFAWSCNSAFLAAAPVVGPGGLADAAATLGLTAEPSLVVPGFLGSVPDEGTNLERAAATIGQGRVLASPLGMATVAASVASGRTVSPVLVDEPGRTPASETTTAGLPWGAPLTDAESSALQQLMHAVVTDGTARDLGRVADRPGLAAAELGAKTGTASWGPTPPRYHGWVIAYHADLAVATFIEDAPGGSGDAVALTAEFLQERE